MENAPGTVARATIADDARERATACADDAEGAGASPPNTPSPPEPPNPEMPNVCPWARIAADWAAVEVFVSVKI